MANKEKIFKRAKFSAVTLRKAKEHIISKLDAKELDESSLSILRIQPSDIEKLYFDEEDEFFGEYRKDVESARYEFTSSKISLDLTYYSQNTSISVTSKSWALIGGVFNIFEEALEDALLPDETNTSAENNSSNVTNATIEEKVPEKRYYDSMNYSAEQKLPSCYVDKKLLDALEKYLIEHVSQISGIPDADLKKGYNIVLKDEEGRERFSSISEYKPERFSDTITSVILSCEANHKETKVDVSIRFVKGYSSPELVITCHASKPKEMTHGIAKGIMSIIGTNRNISYIYHPPFYAQLVLAQVSLYLILMVPYLYANSHKKWMTLSIMVLILSGIYLFVSKRFNPYIMFDSQLQKRLSTQWTWLLSGLATFMVFATGLAILRRDVLGF